MYEGWLHLFIYNQQKHLQPKFSYDIVSVAANFRIQRTSDARKRDHINLLIIVSESPIFTGKLYGLFWKKGQ